MKKILFILPSLEVGGLQRVQITIANQLVIHGYDVTVMILDPIDDLKRELDSKINLIHKPYKDHIGDKIPYIRHKFYDSGMWETRASADKLHQYYIGNEKYDVEIAFFRGLALKIVSGCRDKDVKHLAWVHSDFRKTKSYMNNFKSLADVKKAYGKLDAVVCVSKEAQQGFVNSIGDTDNLKTIYNILPIDEIKHKAKEKPRVKIKKAALNLVLVGRLLDSVKGQKRLIGVVSKLHREGIDLSLTVVGGGPDENLLRQEIEIQDASNYIVMCGNEINPYPYIEQADMLICASYYEGYNLTVAEALILDTPVLSTDCTGPNEILDYGKYGMIVENSEEGLYKGIKKFTDNPKLLLEYKEKAIARKKFFDEKKILDEIMKLFARK